MSRKQGPDVASMLLATARAAKQSEAAAYLDVLDRNARLVRALHDSSLEYRRAVLTMRRIGQAKTLQTAKAAARGFLQSIL